MHLKCENCHTYKFLHERQGRKTHPDKHRCPECYHPFEVLQKAGQSHEMIYMTDDGRYWQIDMTKEVCWEVEPVIVEVTTWERKKINYKICR